MKPHASPLTGVAVSLPELIALQYRTSAFSFLPRQPVRSLLAGKYGSRLRGRGLNFEEIRQYHAGDDIRSMDWKVTARTGKPHTRVYTEERDRPVVAIVDQRLSMFFGSQLNMKSVTAAQIGALSVWKATQDHDRAGALLFNDSDLEQIRPHRSRRNVTRILDRLVDFNSLLIESKDKPGNPDMLNRALESVAARNSHDHLYLVISDFHGLHAETHRLIQQISRNNDVLLFMVHDPLARKIPEKAVLTITDGTRKTEINAGYAKIQQQFPEVLQGRIDQLLKELSNFGVPTLPISNAADTADQLGQLLGPHRVAKPRYRRP